MAKDGAPIRRVVTTHDDSGKAVVMFDGVTPHKMARPDTGIVAWQMWSTNSSPAEMKGKDDRAASIRGIPPAANGSVFRVVDFPPIKEDAKKLPNDAMMSEMGMRPAGKRRPPTHPAMHYTNSIDYAIVLQGEIDMLLDDSEVHMKAGDVMVQQGTNHAWVNRGTEICRIAFILIDATDPCAD
jgi:mannose-6-phosphate isomerase-like protein (cupin superfamily)